MLCDLDTMMTEVMASALSTAFSLGGEFGGTCKSNPNMKLSLSFTNVESRCCCGTSGNGTQLFQLISWEW